MPSDPSWDDRLAVARRDIYHLAGYHAYAEGSGEGEPLLIVVADRGRGLEPVPPAVDVVWVRQRAITSGPRPTASKIWAPR